MNTHTLRAALAVSLCMSWACSGEPEPDQTNEEYTPPTLGERTLPPLGPPADAGDKPEFDAGVFDQPDANSLVTDDVDTCCTLTFAIADDNGMEDELGVRLVGTSFPLSQGLALTYADGVWSAEACIPPEYSGEYVYVFTREFEGEPDDTVVHNPYAPSNEASQNIWLTAETCDEAGLDLHSVTSDP